MTPLQHERITLTHEELYELVWSTPMRKLDLRYGLSEAGLAKVCDAHRIPRPPRGYRAKKAFGKAPRRNPLPRAATRRTGPLRCGTCRRNSGSRRPLPATRLRRRRRTGSRQGLPDSSGGAGVERPRRLTV